jgi:ornithine carbamoyltransferase
LRVQPYKGSETVLLPPEAAELWSRDLVSSRDLSPAQAEAILNLTAVVKARPADFRSALAGKHIVMFFEKASLRTRLTFEAGMTGLGGTVTFVDQTKERLGERETLSDVAHNLERWVHAIVLRTYSHETVEDMAQHSSIPVINALSNLEHPCQALADYFTLQERFGDLKKVTLAYVGDGNNVSHSLMLTAATLGSKIRVATPKGYEPEEEIVTTARAIATQTGAIIEVMNDAKAAVAGADAIYTDAWHSMGWEHEAAQRSKVFARYQVNEKLVAGAAEHAIYMHCLPAHRGQEITDEVMDSPQSVVFDQAENRMHVQKAILLLLLGGEMGHLKIRSANA